MNTAIRAITSTAHYPWCDIADGCGLYSAEDGLHYGRRHVMNWDPNVVEGRSQPDLDELGVRAALHRGQPILDIEVSTATSGCRDLMWLTPAEGRRLAAAILAAADELETATASRDGAT